MTGNHNSTGIVYLGGTFDLLHPGHISLFRAARMIAGPSGLVVVALNRDEFVERYKGHRPVMAYEDRETVLRALRDVDGVICNTGDEDSRPAIGSLRPQYIVVGDDWRTKDYHRQMGFSAEWLVEMGIEIVYVPLVPQRSSTGLRKRAAVTA